jgi:ABC-2 type transport system ATP-binding protein
MIVETMRLSRRFGGRSAVDQVTLALPEGAAMMLAGANGAGKSTLLRLLVNILRPTSGAARLLGRDTRQLGVGDFQRIGYVADSLVLPGRLTVAQYFDYVRPLYECWDPGLERDLRRHFDLPPDKRIDRLSHGMRIKTMLASALAFRPALLILDEPLGGLDPAARDDVLGGLINRADDTSILMASHELTEIEHFATHVAFMEDGRLLFQEELDGLANRVREVTVQLGAAFEAPPQFPATWIAPALSGRSLGFVDRDFSSEPALKSRLEALGFTVSSVIVRPLSLRETVVALTRARSGAGGK